MTPGSRKIVFPAMISLLSIVWPEETATAPQVEDPYRVDSVPASVHAGFQDSNRFTGETFYMHKNTDTIGYDTLELPEKRTGQDSGVFRKGEFRKYWAKVEKEDGFDKLREQMQAQDIDRSWVPRIYLFDSNLVIFPGWFVLRKKNRKH